MLAELHCEFCVVLTHYELVNEGFAGHYRALRSHRRAIGIRRVFLKQTVEVDRCTLVAEGVDYGDLESVPNVTCQGWTGPLAVDPHKWPFEAIRGCRDPGDIPVVCPQHTLGKWVARIAGIGNRAGACCFDGRCRS